MTIQMHTVYHNKTETKLAYVKKKGDISRPMIVFCGGFRSNMQGTKAIFLEEHALQNGYGSLRFDYMGHGGSEGNFEDGTISSWRQDTHTFLNDLTDQREIILVGSSMGGWISLLCAHSLGERLKGLIGISAAPDFTKDLVEDHFSETMRQDLKEKGYVDLPNEYSDEPYIITKALIEDGVSQSILHAPIEIKCPVILLQSKLDTSVPWTKALKIQDQLTSLHVEVVILKDGDHSLSRPQDLELIGHSINRVTISSYI